MDINKILKIILIIAVVLIAGSVFYHYVIFLPQKERTTAAQQKLEAQKKEQQAQQEALKEQQQQEFQAWVNDCIIKAQAEKARRQRLVDNVWLQCSPTILTASDCKKLKDDGYAGIEDYYKQWEANCKMGIANNF